MTRKGLWIGFSYLLGLIAASAEWGKYNLLTAVVVAAVACIGLGLLKNYRENIIVCSVFILFGMSVNTLYTKVVYNKLVSLDNQSITIDGYISDYEILGSDTALIKVIGKVNGIKTQVSFYVDDGGFDYYDKIRVTGTVQKISDSVNFLSEKYNRSKGIFLQGKKADRVELYSKNVNPIFRELKHYRDYLSAVLIQYAGEKEGGYLSAMLCGDKSELTNLEKNQAYRSGIGHLFAVSGTHLIIVTQLFGFLIKGIKSRRLRLIFILTEMWGYAVFSGLSISVVRAAVMMTLVKSSFLFGRKSDCANSLGICAVLLTLRCPYIAVDISFLMSFTAAFAVGEITPRFTALIKTNGLKQKIAESAVTVFVIMFAMLPLNIIFFGGVSIISPLSNLIVVPICTLALSICFFVLIFGWTIVLAEPIILVSKQLIKLAVWLVELFSDLPYSYVYVGKGIWRFAVIISCLLLSAYIYKRKSLLKGFALGTTFVIIWCCIFNMLKFYRDNICIGIIPNSKGTAYALCYDDKCVIFDCAKTKANSGADRYIDSLCVSKINYVFTNGEYGVISAKNDFSYMPELIFASGIFSERGNIKEFEIGNSVDTDNFTITKTYNGYKIQYKSTDIVLTDDGIFIDGNFVDSDDNNYPLEYDLKNNSVRRMSYGFD